MAHSGGSLLAACQTVLARWLCVAHWGDNFVAARGKTRRCAVLVVPIYCMSVLLRLSYRWYNARGPWLIVVCKIVFPSEVTDSPVPVVFSVVVMALITSSSRNSKRQVVQSSNTRLILFFISTILKKNFFLCVNFRKLICIDFILKGVKSRI